MTDAARSASSGASVPFGPFNAAFVGVAFAALLLALVGAWLSISRGQAHLDRALQSYALRDDLHEAHTSLLGARVDLYERNYISAGNRLENARGLLRRAQERSLERRAGPAVTPRDLAVLEADLDEAQRLLARLGQDSGATVPRGTVERATVVK